MGTKANPGAYDCHAAAEPNEPIFTLRGSDPSASLLIELWALIRAEIDPSDDKVLEARECAEACLNWAIRKGKRAAILEVGPALDTVVGAPSTNERLNFDLAIGRLDRVMSQLIGWAKDTERDESDRQTLKHHAEDMIAAGEKILGLLLPSYTCEHCLVTSPKEQWGPGHVLCPKCQKRALSTAERAS